MADGHQLCRELSIHRDYLDKPPSPHAVRRSADAEIDMGQLCSPLHGIALAFCHRVDCAHQTRVGTRSVLRGLFVCIDIAYNVFEREVFAGAAADQVSERTRRIARRRSLVVLATFTTAMLVAFIAPLVGFGLICGALILHLRPDVSGSRS
jgi:hypothetical protein